MLKKALFAAVGVTLAIFVPYLVAEGIYALSHGAQAETSLAYATLSRVFWAQRPGPEDPRDANSRVIVEPAQIESLLGLMKENAVGLGNSPFKVLKTDEAAINEEKDGCLWQKPNQRKVMSYLRSYLFNPFDQLTYFHDVDRKMPPELAEFFARYGFREIHHTTNADGERITVPAVDSPDKVMVAGDSVANGVMLDDMETLSSQLQAHDGSRQYVNLGVARAAAADTVCNLGRAAKRYPKQIREVLYVFCENDFDPSAPYGKPEELVAWLAEFRRRAGIDRITLLYVPYIYNSVPEVTRVRGHSHFSFPTYADEKRRLLDRSAAEQFRIVDFLAVAEEESARVGSQFAPLALYVDHTHLSRIGVERVLPRILGEH